MNHEDEPKGDNTKKYLTLSENSLTIQPQVRCCFGFHFLVEHRSMTWKDVHMISAAEIRRKYYLNTAAGSPLILTFIPVLGSCLILVQRSLVNRVQATPSRYQRLDLFIKVLRLLCPVHLIVGKKLKANMSRHNGKEK